MEEEIWTIASSRTGIVVEVICLLNGRLQVRAAHQRLGGRHFRQRVNCCGLVATARHRREVGERIRWQR
jgi:hypothetical protein